MLVVSSIDGAQINQSYNYAPTPCANFTYAQAASVGQIEAMAAALVEYGGRSDGEAQDEQGQLVADQIGAELSARGFVVTRHPGQFDIEMLCCGQASRRDQF